MKMSVIWSALSKSLNFCEHAVLRRSILLRMKLLRVSTRAWYLEHMSANVVNK